MTTLWQIKNWDCCYVIEPHGSSKLEKNVLFTMISLQTHNCKITEITKTNNSWMMLFLEETHPALSFKCMVTNPGMKEKNFLILRIKHSLRNSSGHQTVLCIIFRKSENCSRRYAYTMIT